VNHRQTNHQQANSEYNSQLCSGANLCHVITLPRPCVTEKAHLFLNVVFVSAYKHVYWNEIGNWRATAFSTRTRNRSIRNSPSTSINDSNAFRGFNPTDFATPFCHSDANLITDLSFKIAA